MCIVKDLPDRTAVDVIGQLTQAEFILLKLRDKCID